MPGGGFLEGRPSADQRRLAEMGGGELKCDRQSRLAKTAGQRDGRMTGRVEWAGVSLQLGDQLRLFAECPDCGESERCEWMHRDQQQVDRAENSGDATAQIEAP
jgi:hypothetical protein